MAVGAAWWLRGSVLLPDWPADLYTVTAMRGRYALADGSVLTLDARSSADVDIGTARRELSLRQGQMLLTVAQHGEAPFLLRSSHGTVRATGRQVMLRREGQGMLALALQGGMEIAPRDGVRRLLRQGQAAWFDSRQSRLLPGVLPALAAAWERGMLVAVNQPLGELVAALRPYRRGTIEITPPAAALRVSGNYSLDDSGATLLALAETLPIALRQGPGGWWTGIDIKAS